MDLTAILFSQILLLITGKYVSGLTMIKKPGTCPGTTERLPADMPSILCYLGLKSIVCDTDNNCPGLDKCCIDVCGRRCKPAKIIDPFVTPGTCPPETQGLVTTCQITADSCQSDRECLWGSKCCPNGCGKTCKKVVKPPQPNLGLPPLPWPGM